MQRTKGFYSPLSSPVIYDLIQDLAWGKKGQLEYILKYLKPEKTDSILDVGCGSGRLLRHLPPCEYVGVDLSRQYIEYANRRVFEGKASFFHADVKQLETMNLPKFSIVSAIGLLHHLDDEDAKFLLGTARNLLQDGGRLVTVDPGYHEGQGIISKFIADHDRGQNVRTPEEYADLFAESFSDVKIEITAQLTRLPVKAFVATGLV